MNLMMNSFVSRLLRCAAVAVFLAVASGCGAPLEDEVAASEQITEEAPGTVHAQRLPTMCSVDDEFYYDRMLCHQSCGEDFSVCQTECGSTSSCLSQCRSSYYGCQDVCDARYC